MMRPSRGFNASARTTIAVVTLAPWLAGCVSGGEPDALSGSSQPVPIVSSTTADYGNYGVSVAGTNWGGVDGFHTQCLGGCRTLAGGGS
jgi:hypothetical protein